MRVVDEILAQFKPPKLKACPFCGKEATIWTERDFPDWVYAVRVGCKHCEISFLNGAIDINEGRAKDIGMGVKTWNERVKE